MSDFFQTGAIATLFARLNGAQRERIDEVLETIGLTDRLHEPAGRLSHGQKQWLEIGMLLMQDPQLLFLDEPVAGMTDAETEQTADLLRSISAQHRSVVVVEDLDLHSQKTRVLLVAGTDSDRRSIDAARDALHWFHTAPEASEVRNRFVLSAVPNANPDALAGGAATRGYPAAPCCR